MCRRGSSLATQARQHGAAGRARQLAEEAVVTELDAGRARFFPQLEADARTHARDALRALDALNLAWRLWMDSRASAEWVREFTVGNPRPYRVAGHA